MGNRNNTEKNFWSTRTPLLSKEDKETFDHVFFILYFWRGIKNSVNLNTNQKPSPEINMYRWNGHVCPVCRKSPKYFFYSSCVEKNNKGAIVHVQKYEILKIQTSTVFEKKELGQVSYNFFYIQRCFKNLSFQLTLNFKK